MSDAVRGRPLAIPADVWNRLQRMLKVFEGGGLMPNKKQPGRLKPGCVLAKNTTASDLTWYAPVALRTSSEVTPTDEDYWLTHPSLEAAAPDEGGSDGWRVGVYQEPCLAGGWGPALVDGLTPVLVHVRNTAHRFARLDGENVTTLLSDAQGPVELLWVESGTGSAKWALARLGMAHAPGNLLEVLNETGEEIPAGGCVIVTDMAEAGIATVAKPTAANDERARPAAYAIPSGGYGHVYTAGAVNVYCNAAAAGNYVGSQSGSWEWAVSDDGTMGIHGVEDAGADLARAWFRLVRRGTAVYIPDGMATIDADNPDANDATTAEMRSEWSGSAATVKKRALFHISGVNLAAGVWLWTNAIEQILGEAIAVGGSRFTALQATPRAYIITADWDPATVTWNTAPTMTAAVPSNTLTSDGGVDANQNLRSAHTGANQLGFAIANLSGGVDCYGIALDFDLSPANAAAGTYIWALIAQTASPSYSKWAQLMPMPWWLF